MTKVKLLIKQYEKEKDALKQLILVDQIQDELKNIRKGLAKKVKWYDW